MLVLLRFALALVLVVAAGPVAAGPITATVALVAKWYGGLTLFSQAVVQLAASAVLTAASQALAGQNRPRTADLVRDLARPTSLPPYRSVYGWYRVPGTPAPWLVKGGQLFGCLILNSRPSHGDFTVYLDKRPLVLSGDVYNFGAGGGAAAVNGRFADHVRVWIGRGDQVGPPADILAAAPELFQASDGWRGLTVIWLHLRAGDADERQARWPAAPPHVEVEGAWSLVWDPRAPSAPPAYSANQALCLLDAAMHNPVRAYPAEHLLMAHWMQAADLAGELVARADGALEMRYAVGGVLIWSDAELEDQLEPLAAAGAGRLMRVGGRLGYVPGGWVEPSLTVSEILEDGGLDYRRWAPADDMPTSVVATYVSAARGYEDAELGAWPIPGALAEDGGLDRPMMLDLSMVTSATQAQRVRSIEGRRARMQRRIQCVLPPRAFDLIGGSCVEVAMPGPYARMDGAYSVEKINPGFDPVGEDEDGVAMRCPAVLTETSPAIYAWDPAVDEEPVVEGLPPDVDPKDVPPPGAVALSVVTVGGRQALRFACDPSPSGYVASYAWEHQADGGAWRAGGSVADDTVDAVGDVYGTLDGVEVGAACRVRVRTVTISGQRSAWVTSAALVVPAVSALAPPPVGVFATPGAGQIAVRFRAPNDADVRSLEVFAAAVNVPLSGALIHGPAAVAPNGLVDVTVAGLAPGDRLYFWARSVDRLGAPSALSSPALSAVAS